MAQFPKATWVKAVEQKCCECIYDPSSFGGTWREQVAACTDASCPLYPVRPLPEGEKHDSPALIPNLVERRRQESRRLSALSERLDRVEAALAEDDHK